MAEIHEIMNIDVHTSGYLWIAFKKDSMKCERRNFVSPHLLNGEVDFERFCRFNSERRLFICRFFKTL